MATYGFWVTAGDAPGMTAWRTRLSFGAPERIWVVGPDPRSRSPNSRQPGTSGKKIPASTRRFLPLAKNGDRTRRASAFGRLNFSLALLVLADLAIRALGGDEAFGTAQALAVITDLPGSAVAVDLALWLGWPGALAEYASLAAWAASPVRLRGLAIAIQLALLSGRREATAEIANLAAHAIRIGFASAWILADVRDALHRIARAIGIAGAEIDRVADMSQAFPVALAF